MNEPNTTVAALVTAMEDLAPTRLAEGWDNVGLLLGDPAAPLRRLLLAVDFTDDVALEAERERCDAVLSYHPPIFEPLKRLVAGGPVFRAARAGIALYSPHTALDVAEGGTNDMLADVLGLTDRGPLRVSGGKDAEYKLVVFVPEKGLEKLANALFDAGAGRIGQYRSCSFRTAGTGTFFGEDGTNPAVGERGKLETVAEIKLETVVPIQRVTRVIDALRSAHPYEEPAFDLVRLAAPPEGAGIGRVGALQDTPRGELVARVKRSLGVGHVLVAGPLEGSVTRAAVCAGSGGSELLREAASRGAGFYLTGELRHHDALWAASRGITVACVLHSNSERAALAPLAARLREKIPGLETRLSDRDRDPFTVV